MTDEPHEVVKLLVARMESHPEEFSSDITSYSSRWERCIADIEAFGNEADKAALNAKLRDIWMVKIHERVMDELLNGEDRRRKAAEENEYERNLSKSLQQSQYGQANQLLNQAYNQPGGLQSINQLNGLLGPGVYSSPTTNLASQSPTQSGPLNSIKKALGI